MCTPCQIEEIDKILISSEILITNVSMLSYDRLQVFRLFRTFGLDSEVEECDIPALSWTVPLVIIKSLYSIFHSSDDSFCSYK